MTQVGMEREGGGLDASTGGRLIVEIARTGQAVCKDPQCLHVDPADGSKKIHKGTMRIGSRYPNPFSPGEFSVSWYHYDCRLLSVQRRQRKRTKWVESEEDLEGFGDLEPAEQEELIETIKEGLKFKDPEKHDGGGGGGAGGAGAGAGEGGPDRQRARQRGGAGGGGGGGDGSPPRARPARDNAGSTEKKTPRPKNQKTMWRPGESIGVNMGKLTRRVWGGVTAGEAGIFMDDLRPDKELYPIHELEPGFEKVIWPPYHDFSDKPTFRERKRKAENEARAAKRKAARSLPFQKR